MASSTEIQRIFRGVPGLFLIVRPDANFTIVAASPDYLSATHTDESIFGRPLFDVFPDSGPPADLSSTRELRESLERVLATRQPDTMATQRYLRVPETAQGYVAERGWSPVNSPVLSESGDIDFIVHRVVEDTAKANRNAIDILESITEGFFSLDRHWRFGYMNGEAHRILGCEPGALVGKVLWEAYPGLEGTEFERNYRLSMDERTSHSFTGYYARLARWYEVSTFPAPEGMAVYFRDVTQQKMLQADRDLLAAESEHQRRVYETALNSTPDFIYVFDVDHRILYANAALMRMWGVDDVRGKKWMDLGYEQWQADMHDREIDEVITTRAPIRGEIPFTGTNGRRVYDYIFAPVLGADGDVVAVAGTTRDVTDREGDEQALREQSIRLAEADRAKDDFLATLAHELRNPLAPLRNAIELLKLAGPAGKTSDRAHAMMERQIAHLTRLVDDLLEVSRISRGAFVLRKERVDVAAVVRNAVETSEPLIKAADHHLDIQLPSEPLWVEGDQVRLAQVLANLLNNAALYTDPCGKIRLSVRREADDAVFTVIDNGIGIEAGEMPRLFEMFSRADRNTARHQGGLGIGLPLSRRLAEMHDGTLQAHSEGLGRGSAFTLRVPAAEAPVVAQPAMVPHETHLNKLRVLVIDDNQDAASSMAELLSVFGAEPRAAYSGPDGLAMFDTWRPAVVLLDIGMPKMNGYDVARAIRSRPDGHNVTLVALTGWAQEDDRLLASEAGFEHHLVKPVEIHLLLRLLEDVAG